MSRRSVVVMASLAGVTLLMAGCTAGDQQVTGEAVPQVPGSSASAVAPSGSGASPGVSASAPAPAKPTPLPSITAAPQEPAAVDPADLAQYVAVAGDGTTFEGAVAEAGQEACDRISYLVQVDEGALLTALSDGELPAAPDAVPLLCPTFLPLLAQADHGFVDGTVAVGKTFVSGKTVVAGKYVASAPSSGCTWRVIDADGATLSEGEWSAKKSAAGRAAKLTVGAKAAQVVSDGCRVWLPREAG